MAGQSVQNDEVTKNIQSALPFGNFDGNGNMDEDYLEGLIENKHLPYLSK